MHIIRNVHNIYAHGLVLKTAGTFQMGEYHIRRRAYFKTMRDFSRGSARSNVTQFFTRSGAIKIDFRELGFYVKMREFLVTACRVNFSPQFVRGEMIVVLVYIHTVSLPTTT